MSYLSDHGFSGFIDAHDGKSQLLMVLNDTKMERHIVTTKDDMISKLENKQGH